MSGVRRVWGTLKSATHSVVKRSIAKLAKISTPLKVNRKFSSSGKPKWWFILHADESTLLALEKDWEKVSLQTGWHIEHCTGPSNAAVATSVHPPSNSSVVDGTLSPEVVVLENDDTNGSLTPISMQHNGNIYPILDPVYDKMSSVAPTTAPKTSTSAVAGELAVASDKDSSMPSSDMQSILDQ